MAIKEADMAIKYKEIIYKLENDDLSLNELKYIDVIEEYMDKEILKQFENGVIKIFLGYASLKQNPNGNSPFNLNEIRRNIMFTELKDKYTRAGWTVTTEHNDGLNASDYLVLTGNYR